MPLQKLVNYPVDTHFRFYCSECPLLSELAQDATIPAVTLNPAEIFSRFQDYGHPGEKLQFTELDIGFSMDEYYDVYAEIYSWMQRMSGPPQMSQTREDERTDLSADAEIILLDNTMKNVSRRFIFRDAWPTSLGAISLDAGSESAAIKGIVTFVFTAMEITPYDKNLTGLGEFPYNH